MRGIFVIRREVWTEAEPRLQAESPCPAYSPGDLDTRVRLARLVRAEAASLSMPRNSAPGIYVTTKDVTVSVVGAVFLVNAEREGSRVAVNFVLVDVPVIDTSATGLDAEPADRRSDKGLHRWIYDGSRFCG